MALLLSVQPAAPGDPFQGEPVLLAEVKAQARIDADLTADDALIQGIIAGARAQAEVRTGAAIRQAIYLQTMDGFPPFGRPLVLAHAGIQSVQAITYADPLAENQRLSLDPSTLDTVNRGRELLLAPLSVPAWTRKAPYAQPGAAMHGVWPQTGRSERAVEITYLAGFAPEDFVSRYPSVRIWILMACAWAYAQREMFMLKLRGSGFEELPPDYMQSLLEPLTVPPRF
ncbi:conserved hypothetical protein [Thiomonas arsenitoxydans]|uniref:Uncharacterized protein n=1 Tax=Thiomonas arsenitoxydans (strain DSM 22701 / CIP 110005 / 3As) TaxID=426114 RepID=D6CTJ8_THIA3|nr:MULTISPECIES: phage head-tail connector protein [Burkholderiales]CQR44458.1 conserved hypothetical protein [Thiomonas sp. CB3]AHB78656.1 hypothetical protein X636_18750 [Pandoraea pnomenusa]CAZ88617.1 putative phage conserved hypothetical protein, phiE125 gp8 [Thiomonas arsenitoxydans]CQR27710.1 conserved hypothetical protein [Thiomonas arsenitoxydans]CQR32117.1 conserved hypothetical protein [Thiomonas arsenitoxydans]